MTAIPKLSLVEGSFEELSLELAAYLDNLRGESSTVVADISPLIADSENSGRPQETNKDAVLKKLITAASALNVAPEREIQPAYNVLIHLISGMEDVRPYLPTVCKQLGAPITSSQHNGTGIALGVLGTVFNVIDPDDDDRYFVLLSIVEVVKNSRNYETLKSQLPPLTAWLEEWEMEPKQERKLFMAISSAAAAANETNDSYIYLLKALRTIQNESASAEARQLSLQALKAALLVEKHFDFQDLTALDSVQALRNSDPIWFELLELFSSENFEDFEDFKESNSSFCSDNNLDEAILNRKMRLLTLASLAAQASQARSLPYSTIAKALHVASEDVETWVIDCIRSGLVEGKLSQQKSEFLVHRSTYRVFGEHQWREVASRLEIWKSSLQSVLGTIRREKEEYIREKEAEATAAAQPQNAWKGGRGQRGQEMGHKPMPVDVE